MIIMERVLGVGYLPGLPRMRQTLAATRNIYWFTTRASLPNPTTFHGAEANPQ